MRILLLHKFHHGFGGAERIYFETARLLEEAGHSVAFFSMQHPDNQPTPWAKYFVREVEYDDRPRSLGEKFRTASSLLWNREATRSLDALITEFRPDVAHAFNVFHQLSPAVFHVLKRRQVPMVLTVCDFKVISPNYFLYHFGKRKIWESTSGLRCIWDRAVKNSYAKSFICALELWLHQFLGSYLLIDTFLAPSAFTIGKYHDLGFSRPLELIHHPVSLPVVSAPQPAVPSLKEIYLSFGRLSPEKGVEVAIRAIALLPEAELWIVGYGPAEEELRALVQELALTERVRFLGAVYGPDLFTLMPQVRAVIFPAVWYENQPFALMDTLAAGVPVVASRIGGIPDVILDGENGFLFAPSNAEDLAGKLQEVSRLAPGPLTLLREKARATAREYTSERYRDEILSVYQALLIKKTVPK